jgi:hypothetical protein
MKYKLFLSIFLFNFGIANAQFQSRSEVISYLCSKAFYDSEKEYKVIFKTADVEFAGKISKQLQVFVNDNLKGIVDQTDVKINPYLAEHGKVDAYLKGLMLDVWFNGPSCPDMWRGKVMCHKFFNLPIDVLFVEGYQK